MKVIIVGATGMVGQSALRECILDEKVQEILTIGRNRTGQQHKKLNEIVLNNLTDLSSIENKITGFDACFFCLGVSSMGKKEEEYTRITYDITISVAKTLARLNPQITFIYVSGSGTDSTEEGRSMWARVKGKTENALLHLPFKAAYMFRPGVIIPLYGVKSKTKLYQFFYDIMKPLNSSLLKLNSVITSEQLGKAMIEVARNGYSNPIIESNQLKNISMRN
ncbi:NAD-dependent epimerase/dehydratase family protein [Paenibacillus radicis (ex Xue et al. 2023)]|uniref:NAD-dependent epimerase/dehydratase family protein n=1 Tax=Paenibacillus radicis (ex Xue et al. 2023) TaxID=2972489 RepID=A0ABT1YJP9_9BACL|nr:NAD-dependent epimerase/dehydratase family protein [Paenibacillus radicis (ex Xue et al. 2023)]MCR8632205.1 NAD-dependent epimerase/dehydratase family protein [Paenibacillus radicis (ex Xue et al. 2023)]